MDSLNTAAYAHPPFHRKHFASERRGNNRRKELKTNTIASRLNRHSVYNSSVRNDIVRTIKLGTREFPDIFLPNVHSTPIVNSSISKVRSKSFDRRLNYDHHHRKIPTISQEIDEELKGAISSNPIISNGGRVVKKRGICGVSWILRLAVSDKSIGKVYRNQVGWTLLCLVIISVLGSMLAYYSRHIFTYHFVYFESNNRSRVLTAGILTVNDNNSREAVSENLTEEVYEYTTTTKTEVDNSRLNLVCRKCRPTLDVCMVESETGIPQCKPAVDINDPTGCGGLCALEVEACRQLHQNYSIYSCKPIETYQRCKSNEWQCKNKLCIPKEKHCDGVINCYDASDERDCEDCDLNENFHCANNTSCIAKSKKCNNIIDCWDGSDEYNCTGCHDDQYGCKNGNCINLTLFCDGYPDCDDKSDEPTGCNTNCGNHEFKCNNSRCILKHYVCDGSDNCGDTSDESNC